MGWEEAAKGFPEIPRGMSVRKIWSNPAVYPLFATIGVATVVCGSFLYKFFGKNSDVAWSKSIRMSHDVGANEKRVEAHNKHFGFRQLNKGDVNIYPFNFIPMSKIADNHRFDKAT